MISPSRTFGATPTVGLGRPSPTGNPHADDMDSRVIFGSRVDLRCPVFGLQRRQAAAPKHEARSDGKNTPKMPTLANSMARRDPPRVRLSTTRGGSSGCSALVSKYAKATSRTNPARRNPIVKGLRHAVVSAWEKPKTSENSPPATSKRPGRSNGS